MEKHDRNQQVKIHAQERDKRQFIHEIQYTQTQFDAPWAQRVKKGKQHNKAPQDAATGPTDELLALTLYVRMVYITTDSRQR